MVQESWFPLRFEVLPGIFAGRLLERGEGFEIREANGAARRLLAVRPALLDRWIAAGLLSSGDFEYSERSGQPLALFPSVIHALTSLEKLPQPGDLNEAIAVAAAMKTARAAMPGASLGDAIFAERLNRLLPLPSGERAELSDEAVLGRYLCGVPVSCHSIRRVSALAPWLTEKDLKAIIAAAGLNSPEQPDAPAKEARPPFILAGRAALEQFFREHIIDVIENEERYRKLGVPFPGGVILHGPPGCGKTFAVEALVAYLDWPIYQVTSASIGSPYVHETGRKIGEVFEEAARHAPSVVVLDEMDAFLGTRTDAHRHQVEEVAEFLRCLQGAQKARVLVIGMTNRPDAVDPAVLRRGRFDHVIDVSLPSAEEVLQVLHRELEGRPCASDLTLLEYARALEGRPLSDAAFLVREAARWAARSGAPLIDRTAFEHAIEAVMGSRTPERRIGF